MPLISSRRTAARTAAAALTILMGLDLLLIAIHLWPTTFVQPDHDHLWLTRDGLLLTSEHGLAELVQYVKTAAVVALLLVAARGDGARAAWHGGWAWATVFGWVALDDALALHERGGSLLREWVGPTVLGLGAQDVGEVVVWGIVGAALLPLLGMAYASDTPHGRGASRRLAGAFALFAFVAGGLDLLHASLGSASGSWHAVLAVAEDGGELLAMSLILALAFALQRTGLRVNPAYRARTVVSLAVGERR